MKNKTKLAERERTKYREWLGGGEGKFTIPTRRAHRTKREKQMIKKTDQKKKGSERNLSKGGFVSFCIFSH